MMSQEPDTIREELAMIDERVDHLSDQDRSSTKVQLLERAAKLAEHLQDDTLKLKYYKEVTDAIYYSSDMELMFIYFPKMLKMLDDRPEDFGYYDKLLTLFKYKWMITQALNYPQIPFARVEALCDDFESRLLAMNHSVRPALSMRCHLEKSRMNYERAVELNEEVERHDRGWLSDCRACEHSSYISSLFNAGRVDEGEVLFEFILADGKKCDSAPFTSYSRVAYHALLRGDMERADQLYRQGWELIQHLARKNSSVFDHHLCYFASSGDLELVKRELHARISEVWVDTQCPESRMDSCARLAYVLDVLSDSGLARLDVPQFDAEELSWDERGLDIERARDAFAQEARRIAELFDKRNGHALQSQETEGTISGEGFKRSE